MTVARTGCPTGEPVDEALAPILGGGALKPIAVGVNCCAPADVTAALERLAGITRLPLVAKPNLGGAWNAADGRFDGAGPSTPDPERLRRWLDVGARLIGGCCGTGTAELAELADLARLLSAH
jgi:homocysteine S-methyltransferase